MNILILENDAFGLKETKKTFELLGHNCFGFTHSDYKDRESDTFINEALTFVENHKIDMCFSYNYFPLLAKSANNVGIPYISIVYDSPFVALYSCTVLLETNYIFVFDDELVRRLNSEGIRTVYYMPLASECKSAPDIMFTSEQRKKLTAEVSFVGALYNEKHNLFDRLTGISDKARGYIEGVMNFQKKIYGANYVEEMLADWVIDELQRVSPYNPLFDGAENPSYVYANYFINRQITREERTTYLSDVAANYPLSLYTLDPNAVIPNASNKGPVYYNTEMPYVFAHSKINLNISLRSIITGIPLRCMDIMAAGGFLLTNYQEDFNKHFVANEEYVYYENEEDMLYKIGYYLNHKREREEIAHNAAEKMRREHTFEIHLNEILCFVARKR